MATAHICVASKWSYTSKHIERGCESKSTLFYVWFQIKAAIKVNTEQLKFNWQVGHDIVEMKVKERWGQSVIEQSVNVPTKHSGNTNHKPNRNREV